MGGRAVTVVAVLASAEQMLVSDSYLATTVAGISGAFGVPIASVYRLFPTKVAILKAVLDVAIADADQDLQSPLDRRQKRRSTGRPAS
ncbi:MAG: TetR/AcrR family transcriptional regulator [Antricoccus sp.]